MYRAVDPELLHRTIQRLERRIEALFPQAGLRNVARELVSLSDCARPTCRELGQPYYLLRIPIWLALASVVGLLALIPLKLKLGWDQINDVLDVIQVLEPSLGAAFFLSALGVFLLGIETRWKRSRALTAIHELRAMAHVVDMHQLTKDPTDPNLGEARMPPDDRPLTPEELTRYLDFCTEMLSLISKLAVLYVQDFPDDVAVGAVDEIENLTNGLSRKIWQKIMIVRAEHQPITFAGASTGDSGSTHR